MLQKITLHLVLIICLCCSINAQPCDVTVPSSYCQTNPVCGLSAIDGFCFTMISDGPTEAWPGCAVIIDDPNWITFTAGSDSLAIQVSVSNCQANVGVQVEIYEIAGQIIFGSNDSFCLQENLGSPLTNCVYALTPNAPGIPFILDVPTVPGKIYGIVFDGWAGDLCQIELEVLLGSDPPSFDSLVLPDPQFDETLFPFEGDTICAESQDVEFSLPHEIVGAIVYQWSLDGVPIPISNPESLNVFVDFNDPGIFELCYQVSNFCDTSQQHCINVLVVDCLNETEALSTESKCLILQNPIDELLQFTCSYSLSSTIRVIDIQGYVWHGQKNNDLQVGEVINIDVSNIPSGIYFLIFENSNRPSIQPFVKR